MSILKTKYKPIYFKIPHKLKKRLDKHLIDFEQTLGKYFIPLIEGDLDYYEGMEEVGKDNIVYCEECAVDNEKVEMELEASSFHWYGCPQCGYKKFVR